MTTATGNAVLRAYNRCAKNISDKRLNTTATSAGFIFAPRQKRGQRDGWQVFVKMIRYSDAKLKKSKLSGGLWGRV